MIYALSIITNYINVKNKKTAKKWRMTLIPFAIYCFYAELLYVCSGILNFSFLIYN